MFEEDGSLDPLLKFLLYGVIALAAARTLRQWLTVGLWGWVADHPRWTALITAGLVGALILLALLIGFLSEAVEADGVAGEEEDEPGVLTFRMSELTAMRPIDALTRLGSSDSAGRGQ